jgi:hypothetical protein
MKTSMSHDFAGETESWRSALGKVAAIVLGVVALGAFGVYYLVCISGPHLVVTHDGAEVGIEPQFLEYDLGIDRLLLEDVTEGRRVLVATSNREKPMLLIRLKPGLQNLETLIGPNGRAIDGEHPITLVHGHKYRVTISGNNGFANSTSSSIDVDL